MKKNIFKKGDLVRVILIDEYNNELILNSLHVISSVSKDKEPFVYLYSWNRYSIENGFFSYRFKKIKAGDLTPEELISYMKYKFKIGKVI